MVNDILPLADWFPAFQWPPVPCPDCRSGMTTTDRQKISEVPTYLSEQSMHYDDCEPDWEHGHFHGVIDCGNAQCRTRMVVAGDFQTKEFDEPVGGYPYQGRHYDRLYKLHYTHPPVLIMELPEGVTEEVRNLVRDASRLVWMDPSPAGGRLRAALEALMDNFRIKKQTPKRKPIFLDTRLQEFAAKKPEVAEFFSAVKWIGNAGTHGSSPLTSSEVLDAADLMEHGFRLLYDKSALALKRKAAAINKAKRPLRTRVKK